MNNETFIRHGWQCPICKTVYSPEHGPSTVLEEILVGSVHPCWFKFEVQSFSLIQHKTDKSVCIIAYIKEGDEE